jgi:hypothetical protein
MGGHGFRQSGTGDETLVEIFEKTNPATRKTGLRGFQCSKNRNARG